MILDVIFLFIQLYIATAIVFVLHEVGHLGQRIHFKFKFPLPEAWSQSAYLSWGGLAMNVLIFVGVAYFKPEILILQLIGLVAWIHFILYAILGSFNYEPKIPKYLWGAWVFDDVPNELWFIYVPLGIAGFWLYKEYYIPLVISLLQSTMLAVSTK